MKPPTILTPLGRIMDRLRGYFFDGRLGIANLSLSKEELRTGGELLDLTVKQVQLFIQAVEPGVAGFMVSVPQLDELTIQISLFNDDETVLKNFIKTVREFQKTTELPMILDGNGCEELYLKEILSKIGDVVVVREIGMQVDHYKGRVLYFSARKNGQILNLSQIEEGLNNVRKELGEEERGKETLIMYTYLSDEIRDHFLKKPCLILLNPEGLIDQLDKQLQLMTKIGFHGGQLALLRIQSWVTKNNASA